MHTYRSIFTLACLLISSCAHQPYSVPTDSSKKQKPTHEIYVIKHGWHTAFVLPAHSVQAKMPELHTRFPHAPYLTFGWGDAEVYQADETTLWASTIAILLPTPSVIHVVARQQPPTLAKSNNVAALCLTDNHYASLLQYISNSFQYTSNNKLIPTPLDDGKNSQFYYAKGTYHLMNTCNHWTAKGLQSAGFDIFPALKFTSISIAHYLEPYNNSCYDSGSTQSGRGK